MTIRYLILLCSLIILLGCEKKHEFEDNFLDCFYGSYSGVRPKLEAVEAFFIRHHVLRDSTSESYMQALTTFCANEGIPFTITHELIKDFQALEKIPTSMECLDQALYNESGFKNSKYYRLVMAFEKCEKSQVSPEEFFRNEVPMIINKGDFEHRFYKYLALMYGFGVIKTEIMLHPEIYG
jgi:hypothetical protein